MGLRSPFLYSNFLRGLFKYSSLYINFNRVLGVAGHNDIAHAAVIIVAAGDGERGASINYIIEGGELEGSVGIANNHRETAGANWQRLHLLICLD